MKKRLMHWLLPLIAILAITTVMMLSISLSMAYAVPTTTSQHTHSVAPAAPGSIIPDSFWRG